MVDEGIKELLAAHVAVSGWVAEIGVLPAKPDRVLGILTTGGVEPNPRWLLDFPAAQVTVRAEPGAYVAARNEAYAVKDILLGLTPQEVDGDWWVSITMGSDVAFVGRDENFRPLFTVNFRLIIEPAPNANTNRLAL